MENDRTDVAHLFCFQKNNKKHNLGLAGGWHGVGGGLAWGWPGAVMEAGGRLEMEGVGGLSPPTNIFSTIFIISIPDY